tara:strand:- start:387 stop:698 length:312 start_codon:yes stop_codon:yes gene_type:complete
MKVKRNDLNRLIINDFMLNKLPNGYNQNFKNKYVWSLANELDDKVCYIKTSMGEEKIFLTDKNDIDYSCERIQEAIENIDSIYEEEKLIDKYCMENGWTYSGT